MEGPVASNMPIKVPLEVTLVKVTVAFDTLAVFPNVLVTVSSRAQLEPDRLSVPKVFPVMVPVVIGVAPAELMVVLLERAAPAGVKAKTEAAISVWVEGDQAK